MPTVYSYSIGVQRDIGWGIERRHRLRRHAVAPQPAPDGPQRHPLRRDVPARGPGPDALRRRRAGRGAGLPAAHRDAGLALQRRERAQRRTCCGPTPGYGSMRSAASTARRRYNSLQAALQRRFSRSLTFGVSYTLSRAKTRLGGRRRRDPPVRPRRLRLRAGQLRPHPLLRGQLRLERAQGQQAPRRRPASRAALLDNWTLSGITWIASGNPDRADALSIAGVERRATACSAPTRAATSGGLQPRFRVEGDPQGGPDDDRPRRRFSVPGHRRPRPLRSLLPAQPRLQQPRPVGLQELPDPGGNGARYLQLRRGDVQRLQPQRSSRA